MHLASLGHRRIQPGCRSIIPPHKPLKFGEFPDHFGLQIGFGHAGGFSGQIGFRADQRCDLAGQCLDPRDAVGLRAQFVVEGHGSQPRAHPLKPHGFDGPQVVFPEEPRIR